MEGLDATHALLLVGGGLVAGVVNTIAGGGSFLTVPLLVLAGLPGTLANGTNRIGVLVQYFAAAWRFRAEGFFEPRAVARVLVPVALGSALGALWASRLADAAFQRAFGVLMLVLLLPTLRQLSGPGNGLRPPGRRLGPALSSLLFFAVGLYAGAFQAGLGLPLLFVLLHAGWDAVRANAIKAGVSVVATLAAVPIFAARGLVAWLPALLLAAGFWLGGSLGARLAVRGGERIVRPVLALAVVVLAGHMLGLY